jgi:ketosteroid isomerase-like protein
MGTGSQASSARATAERYVELVNGGDFDGVGDLFAVDAEHFPPIGGRAVGREAIRAFYKGWAASLGATIHPLRFVSDGPNCVLEFEATTLDNRDGPRALSMEIITVDEEGKIIRMAIYRRPSNAPPEAGL